ncbi:MAP kinase-interacting serine/threonine-protein kinase 1-like [Homarus americanus]|uniref:MAP kinase-interacting serine/threonine-protein kinase 1-like n=1 Tax=Homarus americanus TaxID=6706 RepID=UPI001C46C5F7|nr:MAP kinase-interacting serine/threonine-protein kinase 1-like [Homarus americanus]
MDALDIFEYTVSISYSSDLDLSSSSSQDSPAVKMDDSHLPRVSYNDITNQRVLGQGAYGIARLVSLKLANGGVVPAVAKTSHEGQSLMAEALALYHLNGAGGAPVLYGVTSEDPQALVMEYCSGVTVDKFLESHSKEECLEAFTSMSEALDQLHAKGYAHRDLHEENIIIDASCRPYTAHIIDLGCAIRLKNDGRDSDQRNKGYDWDSLSDVLMESVVTWSSDSVDGRSQWLLGLVALLMAGVSGYLV